MKPAFVVFLGLYVTATVVVTGSWFRGHLSGQQDVPASASGRTVPAFLNSIDDRLHIARWRGGLDVTSEFSSYCKGMSLPEIVTLFSRGAQRASLPERNGPVFYMVKLRQGDMDQLASYLSHFPFTPQLEFWITLTIATPDMKLVEAKIIDKAAYP